MASPVRLEMTKWGDLPHWEFDAVLLGSDEHGDWVGIPAGTPMSRPGAQFVPPVDSVVLVPAATPWWLATFYAPGFRVEVYVDITAPAVLGRAGAPRSRPRPRRRPRRDRTGLGRRRGRVRRAPRRARLSRRRRRSRVADCDDVHARSATGYRPFDGLAPEPWLRRVKDVCGSL